MAPKTDFWTPYAPDDRAPWTLQRVYTPLKLNQGLPELIEYSCSENNRDVRHLVPTKPASENQ